MKSLQNWINSGPPSRKKYGYRLLVMLAVAAFLLAGYHSFLPFLKQLEGILLGLLERIADVLLQHSGTDMHIEDHRIFRAGEEVFLIEYFRNKRRTVAILGLIWLTPARLQRKVVFSVLLITIAFIGSMLDITLMALLIPRARDVESALLMAITPHLILLTTLFCTWLWLEKRNIHKYLAILGINIARLLRKVPTIFVLLLLYDILGKFVMGCFPLDPWNRFYLEITLRILDLINYPFWIDGDVIVGYEASLIIVNGCLGISTLFMFSAIVFLTGNNDLKTWLYILVGVVLLSVINITRIVLLFIQIQEYTRANELFHSLYQYIVYGIVFILWIIWFEKYSDIRRSGGNVEGDQSLRAETGTVGG